MTTTARRAYDATRVDLANRAGGIAAVLRSRASSNPPDDRTLEARVRTQLGRVCAQPRAIRVTSIDGVITLTGSATASEVSAIEAAVAGVRGVNDVNNQLAVRADGVAIPSLQRRVMRPGRWMAWARSGWLPAARLTAGLGAASMAVAVAARRG
jgi:hypothetical protein